MPQRLEAWFDSGAWNPMAWDAPFPVVAAALFVIVLLRAGLTYLLGRLAAAGGRHTRAARVMERPGFMQAVERINQLGAPVVTLSFLTVGVQTVVNFSAGFLRMPLWRYLPALAAGAVIWAMVYASVGFVGLGAFALAWRQHPALAIGLVLGAAALLAFLVTRRRGTSSGG
ncbi:MULTISPECIES: DedA family protein [unclassified Luteococcus]|uniref:DedA family protein n=1 Tax=unclassified Luteococcus TaxID=2639923 RepID=UPI00313D89B6